MRRLIFCFDGSWNGLAEGKQPTNVQLVAESVLPLTENGESQIVYYDEGVGTESDEIIRGGVYGKGLTKNIREAYRFLIFNYQPGDEIFCFGFSRGAFTALSFIGFIRSALILPTVEANKIDKAFELYQENASVEGVDSEKVRRFRAENCPFLCANDEDARWRQENINGWQPEHAENLKVKYVGVWDAVGSLGWKLFKSIFSDKTDIAYKLHLTDLSNMVDSARHAVAIDEKRKHFKPTLWKNLEDLNAPFGGDNGRDRPYMQQWFPGDHGSVGGGGESRGLSNGSLQWVLEGSARKGLRFDLGERSQLTKIKYDVTAPLINTPVRGIGKKALNWIKGLFLTADRGKPSNVNELSYQVLRRWIAQANSLPEKVEYRPASILHLREEIEVKVLDFNPIQLKYDSSPVEYVIQPGDTLSKIADKKLHDRNRYSEIFDMNRDKLDTPDYVNPGDTILLPPK